MAQGVSEEAFVTGCSPGVDGKGSQNVAATRSARSVLWKALRGTPLTMGEVVGAVFALAICWLVSRSSAAV